MESRKERTLEKREQLARELGYESAKAMYYDLYVNLNLSQREIGNKFSVSGSAIAKDLKFYNIPTRSVGGYNQKPETSILDKIACLSIKFLQNANITNIVKKVNNTNDPQKQYYNYEHIREYLKKHLGIEK